MNRVNKLSPSILAADFANLGQNIIEVERAGADMLHIDVMDGVFVPSISFGMPLISSIRKNTGLPFDVHLMIEEPGRYIDEFKKCGADMLTVHVEACTHLNRVISQIREAGLKAAVALNPSTSLSTLDYILKDVDMVLLMTVNPGFGGQKFIEDSVEKIKELRQKADRLGIDIDIQVDGGINDITLPKVLDAGANVIVAGTSVFKGDITENISRIKEMMK